MIIEKDNNEVNTYYDTRNMFTIDDIYAIKTYNFLNTNNKYDRNATIRKKLYTIFTSNIFTSTTNDTYKKLVYCTYKKLTKTTNKKDLVSIYNNVKIQLLNSNHDVVKTCYKSLEKMYKKDEDTVLNEFVHRIISKYFYYFIREYDHNNTAEIAKTVSIDPDFNVLDCYDEDIPKKKTNNIREIAEMQLILSMYQITKSNNNRHLCFDCPVDICNCPKIMDDTKKTIDCYDFITSGMQRYNDKTGELEDFYVTDCKLLTKTKKENNIYY